MHALDLTVIGVYIVAMLGIGVYFMRRNTDAEDYYLAGRGMGSWHIGLSVVATDVGGGFSIGLGGLGFMMGIAGSWMLFTGLVGAWTSAVLLIPRVRRLGAEHRFFTLPHFFGHYYGARVAYLAGVISAIGYLGFTASQVLAGAKLASASFQGLDHTTALLVMGGIVVVYTVMGGLTAVIHTDTIQWIVLMVGLCFVGIPVAYLGIGGLEAIRTTLPDGFLSLGNVSWTRLVNWSVTIIPIWYVGMTLYQRIYASRSEADAKRAWFVAGLFEWPVMAFMGVLLGLMARVAADQGMFAALGFHDVAALDAEMGLPLLLRQVLPVGLKGLMVAAYFSAIMSTADSCLMASSGNVATDLLDPLLPFDADSPKAVRLSQGVTLVLGIAALVLAASMQNVLQLMLHSYAFMVSGLFVPVIGVLTGHHGSRAGAFGSMLLGGVTTSTLAALEGMKLLQLPLGLDANIFGIAVSAAVFALFGRRAP